jgi:hypothetical protein
MIVDIINVKCGVGQEVHHSFGVRTLLSDVLQQILSGDLFNKPLQVLYVPDPMGYVKISVVIEAGMKITQLSGLYVPQHKTKRQVDGKCSWLLCESMACHLWKS